MPLNGADKGRQGSFRKTRGGMCYSPSPAGMHCSPWNLVFVGIFESSNELSFEDFSTFEYSNLRSKMFFEFFRCAQEVLQAHPTLSPASQSSPETPSQSSTQLAQHPAPQRSADLKSSPSPSRHLDDLLDLGSQDSEEYDPDYVVVNEVFDVSAQFDTFRQVIVESGVTRPYLDLILWKSVPNPHTPIFGDPKYAWLTPLSTYGRCFGKCLSADCKHVAVERDLPCALVACAFPFAVPNKKGSPTPIIRLLALVWHAYSAVESWLEDCTLMLRIPSSEPSGLGKCTSTGRLNEVKVTAQARGGGEAAQSDERAQQAEGVQQVQSTTPLKWQTVLQAAVAAGVQHGYMGGDIPEWEVPHLPCS